MQTFDLSSLELPRELPVSLPSKLVDQRPDVRMAEENLHAASAQIGVAIANMLPNITISANAGSLATQMAQLFTPGNQFWSVAGGVTQPLFDGGTLLHKTRAARAAYDQALAQYRSTVLTAFQNVADTLYAVQFDSEALKAAVLAEKDAEISLNAARLQLKLGGTSTLGVLVAEQAFEQTTVNLVQARAIRFADTVALFQALGGGWWNRNDKTGPQPDVMDAGRDQEKDRTANVAPIETACAAQGDASCAGH